AVVSHWKGLASPAYETDYLASPEGDEDEDGPQADPDFADPMYRDAVVLVLEMGKASTSTLQRRLRLGYGRAARILDAMERDGIIGPPDGSRPRPVLKRPEWLDEASGGEAGGS
ncbi:MAG: DNA translocase FtsK, partial [Bryobacterales bacterium]|nr:DNA translocase FtsK [Bryobacterales bacterium]